jgi:hypothetical protein
LPVSGIERGAAAYRLDTDIGFRAEVVRRKAAAFPGELTLERDTAVDPVVPLYLGDVPWGVIGLWSSARTRMHWPLRPTLRERDDDE